MIVRDEAAMIPGCLESLRGHVDEVVVVDTGSVDATPQIVASFGARLLHHKWDGDFSAARNRALDAVSGDWVLYIDADERLVPAAGAALRDVVTAPGHAAFMMKFRPKVGYSPYNELRLFRSDPRIRFEMRIHERVLPSVLRVCESDGLVIGQTELGLRHLGYEGDQSHKHGRNLPLLARAVDDDPDRVYYWWHLGETLAAVGKSREAEAALRTGIETAQRTRTSRALLEANLAVHALARVYLEARQPSNAMAVLQEGLSIRPDDPALLLLKARSLVDLGRYSEALPLLSGLLLDDPEEFCDPDVAYDLRIFGEWAYDLIGVAQFRLERFSDAREAFLAAAAYAPDPSQHSARAAVAAALANARISTGPSA
ncbi:glycosyltransferase [Mesorhizobium sp. KR9-304]|uniref:glycosyltransferase n=1 Tax=Mesorhizobium sp. KR9-304 TaxID=3156614 RepID=UPI0032B3D007